MGNACFMQQMLLNVLIMQADIRVRIVVKTKTTFSILTIAEFVLPCYKKTAIGSVCSLKKAKEVKPYGLTSLP